MKVDHAGSILLEADLKSGEEMPALPTATHFPERPPLLERIALLEKMESAAKGLGQRHDVTEQFVALVPPVKSGSTRRVAIFRATGAVHDESAGGTPQRGIGARFFLGAHRPQAEQ